MQTKPAVSYQFGPFQVNLASRELLKNGRRIPLQELPYRLLVALLENSGRVVSRQELRTELWPRDTFVDFDSSLRVAVGKLREALNDNANDPRYIETLPKLGYRFLQSQVDRTELCSEVKESTNDPEPLPTASSPIVLSQRRTRYATYSKAAITALLLSAGGMFLWQQRSRTSPLTAKDTLVLADFANTTGDSVFDGTLRQGLAIQLAQSPFLKVMDDEQVQQTLRLMSLSPEARVTPKVAQEVCVRGAAAATIEGSIAALGKRYVITLQAVTCRGGVTLAREQIEADDKEHVLKALGSAASAMRVQLGESRSSIQRSNISLDTVTTSSLDALQNYTEARTELNAGRFRGARPLLERAIALDPKFAMAYYYLATTAINEGNDGGEYEKEAFALIDRVSELERYYIAGGYYESTGELERAMDAYRRGIANYPREWGFHNNLGLLYIDLGRFEAGLEEGRAATQLQPDAEAPYRRQLDALLRLDRLDEAKKVAESAHARGIDGARLHQRFLEMAYITGDKAAVLRELEWYAGRPEEYISLQLQAIRRNLSGERHESSTLYKRAAELALRQGMNRLADDIQEADAYADARSGKCGTVRRLGRPALALALCGDRTRAERIAVEISKRFPEGTLWNAVQLPVIRAAVALQADQPAKAVELLSSAAPYERAHPEAVYFRGLAYLRLRKGWQAAAEFQKVLLHRGASWSMRYPNLGLCYAISQIGLARAYALLGEETKARQSFQDFFALWKAADSNLPILQQAKAEYAKLR